MVCRFGRTCYNYLGGGLLPCLGTYDVDDFRQIVPKAIVAETGGVQRIGLSRYSLSSYHTHAGSQHMSLRNFRSWTVGLAIGICCLWAGDQSTWAASADAMVASHKQVRVIRPALEKSLARLNTFAMSPKGELWLCCSAEGAMPAEDGEKPKPGCLLVYSVEGSLLKAIGLDFIPQAINFSQDGVPFLAGDGKVARLTLEGEVDQVIDAPNLLPEEELIAKLREKNQAMINRLLEGGESQIKRMEEQIAKLEGDLKESEDKETDAKETEGDESEDAVANKRMKARSEARLTVLKQQLDMQKQMLDQQKTAYEGMLGADVSVSQVARSTGIAVAKEDLFVSLPSIEGQGYAIYRMTHDLTEPKLVVDSMSGCCGQLDIQSDGTHLIVAENSAFKVRYFDRDGVDVRSFGERSDSNYGSETSLTGWGSCCNPMNVRCINDKEILVAESSIGHIKRYSPAGDFLGLVGTAKIAGGCKHVAIAKDSQRDWYFMMNTAGNNIAVLVPLSEAPSETEDERDTRLAMEGLGQKLIGAWKAEPKEVAKRRVATRRIIVEKAQSTEESETEEASTEESETEASTETADQTDAIEVELSLGDESSTEDDSSDESNESETSEEEVVVDSFDFGQYIMDQNRYLRFEADGNVSRVEPVAAVAPTATTERKGFFGAIASIFIGESTPATQTVPEEKTRWSAIRQDGDVVQFALIESDVQNYVAAVRFIDDERAEFKWYYNEVSGEPMATTTYRKVAEAAKPEACDSATCKGADCDKENCPHAHAAEASATTTAPVEAPADAPIDLPSDLNEKE
jgi:hypothetical protein